MELKELHIGKLVENTLNTILPTLPSNGEMS